MTKHLRFDMLASYYDKEDSMPLEDVALSKMHPQAAMKCLGITYQHTTPQTTGDQWWFWNCENCPDELPKFLSELEIDPQECVGFGLDQELVDSINSNFQGE